MVLQIVNIVIIPLFILFNFSKQDEKLIPKVVVNLHLLLCDESVQVQKRVIQASSSVYKNMIIWLSKAQVITDDIEQAWDVLNHIKVFKNNFYQQYKCNI